MAASKIKKRVEDLLKKSVECEERYLIYKAKGYADMIVHYEKGQANAFFLAAYLLALDVSEKYADEIDEEMKVLRGRA